MMLPPVAARLRTFTSVTTIIGNPPRIYRQGRAPQGVNRPYVTWHLVAGTPENVLDQVPDMDRQTIQVDCWHPDDRGAQTLATAVRDAIEPIAHLVSMPVNEREVETDLYRIALQFDWFLLRAQPIT
jgi:hypothetical protein